MKWRYAKETGTSFFRNINGGCRLASNLTEPQIIMSSWLNYYDWIYSGEGPELDMDTIEDDELLDLAVDKWKREIKNPGKNTKHWDG